MIVPEALMRNSEFNRGPSDHFSHCSQAAISVSEIGQNAITLVLRSAAGLGISISILLRLHT